ncbi:EAL domain-containing protein [Sulfurimonas sp.]|nr:EAL domain-containing protein [Sulfurimonas sp.]
MFQDIKLGKFSLIIIFLFPIVWLISGYFYTDNRIKELTDQKYSEIVKEMNNELKTLISEKAEAVLIITMSIAQNPQIKKMLKHKTGEMELDIFSEELRQSTSLKNIWFQVVSADGKSIYRSWTKKTGNLKNIRLDVVEMIESPKIMSSISVGKFDLSFKSMVPLFDENDVFIGFVETIAKFNSISIKMQNKQYDTVILVDKKYKKQLTRPFTRTFIEDYYVANLNAKKELLYLIEEETVPHFIHANKNHVCKDVDKLVGLYELKDIHGDSMSYFLLFHDIAKIDKNIIIQARDRSTLFVVAIFFFILLFYYYVYSMKYKKFIQSVNTRLGHEVQNKTKELQHIANHDNLTGLPNRLLFLDRLKQSIKHSKRNNTSVSVLFLDLDRFKEVNDTYGHDVGDKLLQKISNKLSHIIREEDTVSRLGGDEFTIILNDLNENDIINITQKIITIMQEKISIDDINIFITFSIGISNFPQDGDTPAILLRNADTAMYKAKELGKNQYQFYSPQMTKIAVHRASIEHDVRLAIENDEFIPYFQPKIDAKSGKIIGAEALVRWDHPTKGLIFPDKFITIAEDAGLIMSIDKLMMKKTLTIMQKWQEEGLNTGTLSLNLSMRQLEHEQCLDNLKKLLDEYTVASKDIELEITENQIMSNPESAIKILKGIRKLGLSISVDDFGTGYSSLSYLKQLPINKLKIDKSFIDDLPDDKDDVAIVEAIIGLSKSLNLDIIAEGVETKEQLDFLVLRGCSNIQGYYYSKPIPADEYKRFLIGYQ